MKLFKGLKGVFEEFSALLAGFKLAMILIGWFGFGSVAKWVIEHWYPFTRWIWDLVSLRLGLPEFPIAVKDSLTALVFFLPLGISAAFIPPSHGVASTPARLRIVALLLGMVLLLVVSKDAITEVVFFGSGEK